jgi:hypothetical protein
MSIRRICVEIAKNMYTYRAGIIAKNKLGTRSVRYTEDNLQTTPPKKDQWASGFQAQRKTHQPQKHLNWPAKRVLRPEQPPNPASQERPAGEWVRSAA